MNLSVRVKTVKLLKENIEVNLQDLALGSDFLDMMISRAQGTKEKINKHY